MTLKVTEPVRSAILVIARLLILDMMLKLSLWG